MHKGFAKALLGCNLEEQCGLLVRSSAGWLMAIPIQTLLFTAK